MRWLSPVLLIVILSWTSRASPCAPAWRHDSSPVTIAHEDALIVWDEPRHLEHFIRSAVFDTGLKSFGFIVPTPSRPILAEADERTTQILGAATRASIVVEDRWVPAPIGCTMLPLFFMRTARVGSATAGEPMGGVTVLDEARVAGLDATVIEAADMTSLADWLRAHDFELREALARWLAVYVQRSGF